MSKKNKLCKKCTKLQHKSNFKRKLKQKNRIKFKKNLKLLYTSRKIIMKLLKPIISFLSALYDKVA